MIPRFLLMITFVLTAYAAPVSTTAMAQESRSPSSSKLISTAASDNVNELYVAIMGEIDTPGTYRLNSSSLKLHRVVQCAQGFTADASKAIRVIRPGRASQTEIFSEKSDSRLMPGDLLIVESKRAVAKSGKIADGTSRDSQTIRASYEEGTIRAGIQIALLNVLDYPIVLRLRPDQANASYLVQALGQPISLLANTRVITPNVPGRQTSDTAKQAARLEDGSVLVFEAGKINRGQLPVTLPKPIDCDIEVTPQDELVGFNHRHSPDLRNLGQHIFWSNPDPFDSSSRLIRHASIVSRNHPDQIPEMLDSELETDGDANRLLTDSNEHLRSSENESVSEEDDANSAMIAGTSAANSFEPVEPDPARFSFVHLMIIFLVVGALVAGAVLLRHVLATNAATLSAALDVIQSTDAVQNVSASKNEKRSVAPLFGSDAEPQVNDEQIVFPIGLDHSGRIAVTSKAALISTFQSLSQNADQIGPSDQSSGKSPLTDESCDNEEAMTISIRLPSAMETSRSEIDMSTGTHDSSKDVLANSMTDPASTPLARALQQLEQGRCA